MRWLSKFYWLLIAAKHSNTGTDIAFGTPLLVVFACSAGGKPMSRQSRVKDACFVNFFFASSSAWSCCISVSVTTVCTLLVLLFIVSDLCSSVSSFFFVVKRNR